MEKEKEREKEKEKESSEKRKKRNSKTHEEVREKDELEEFLNGPSLTPVDTSYEAFQRLLEDIIVPMGKEPLSPMHHVIEEIEDSLFEMEFDMDVDKIRLGYEIL